MQLLTGQVPYSTIREMYVPLTVMKGVTPRNLSSRLRYEIPRSGELWALLEQCWEQTILRPSMHEVRLCLQKFDL
jgi:hypothetical protein